MAQLTLPALSPNTGPLVALEPLPVLPTCSCLDCPCPPFTWKSYQILMLCIDVTCMKSSLISHLCSLFESECHQALPPYQINLEISEAQTSYFPFTPHSDVSQAALLGSSSLAVTQGSLLLLSANSAILAAFHGEEAKTWKMLAHS